MQVDCNPQQDGCVSHACTFPLLHACLGRCWYRTPGPVGARMSNVAYTRAMRHARHHLYALLHGWNLCDGPDMCNSVTNTNALVQGVAATRTCQRTSAASQMRSAKARRGRASTCSCKTWLLSTITRASASPRCALTLLFSRAFFQRFLQDLVLQPEHQRLPGAHLRSSIWRLF